MNKTIALLCLTTCSWAIAATSSGPIEGTLEKGAVYSAIFEVSPGSGDLVGHAFKNQSPVGKAILQNCLPGMLCNIAQYSSRSMNDTEALKFNASPSGWLEITMARNVAMASAVSRYDKKVQSRYGVLSVNEGDNTLQFKGKPLSPAVQGNNSLSIVASYALGKNDVYLLQDNGGSGCPAMFRFASVTAAGVRVTPEFGTCSDIIYPTSDGKAGVTVAMVGFVGPLESKAEQEKAGRTKVVFGFLNGEVREGGKLIK